MVLSIACTHKPFFTQPIFLTNTADKLRVPASEGSFEREFRLYSVTTYLPKEIQLYSRVGLMSLSLELKLKSGLNPESKVACRSFAVQASKFETQEYLEQINLTESNQTFTITPNIQSVYCQYSGSDRHVDIAANYKLIPYAPSPFEYGGEELVKTIEQKTTLQTFIEKLKSAQVFDKNLVKELEGLGQLNLIKKKINANSIFNFVADINEGDYLEQIKSNGSANPGGILSTEYGPEGTNGARIPLNKNRLLLPNEEPFSLVCGIKEGSSYQRILYRGRQNLGVGKSDIKGALYCSFNTRVDSFANATGSFDVAFYSFNKSKVLLALSDQIHSLEQKIVQFEGHKKDIIIKQSLGQSRSFEYYLLQISENDRVWRLMEPPKYCAETEIAPIYKFEEGARMSTNSTGEFCSNPILLSNKQGIASCDGLKGDEHYHGRLFLFNEKMQNLKKVTVKSLKVDEMNSSIDASRMPILLKDDNGKEKSFAVSTYDGRILIYDLNLATLGTISPKNVHMINDLLPLGKKKFATVIDYENDQFEQTHSKLHIFEEDKMLAAIDIPEADITTYSELFYSTLDNKIYLSTDKGKLLIYTSEGVLLNNILVEDKVQLSKVNRDDWGLYLGSRSGKVYFLDKDELKPELIYSVPHSGTTEVDISSGKSIPRPPAIFHQPLLFGQDDLVITSAQDGRLHFLSRKGVLRKIVQTNFVSSLFSVESMDVGEGKIIVATSISYMNFYLPSGENIATYTNTGAENFYVPLHLTGSSYVAGMYKGVFKFNLKKKETTGKSEFFKICN